MNSTQNPALLTADVDNQASARFDKDSRGSLPKCYDDILPGRNIK